MLYQSLSADPAAVLWPLCAWLGLEYSDALAELNPREYHTIVGNEIRSSAGWPYVADERWRRRLTPARLRIFGRSAGVENRRLGYGGA